MSVKKLFFLLALLCFVFKIPYGQDQESRTPPPLVCGFTGGQPDLRMDEPINDGKPILNPNAAIITVRIAIHVARNDIGRLGSSVAEIEQAVQKLNDDFSGVTGANCYYNPGTTGNPATYDTGIRFCAQIVMHDDDDLLFNSNLAAIAPVSSTQINIYYNLFGFGGSSWGGFASGLCNFPCYAWCKSYLGYPEPNCPTPFIPGCVNPPNPCTPGVHPYTTQVVMTHEIAHLFGLGHSGACFNYMNSAASVWSWQFDAGQVATMRNCLMTTLAPYTIVTPCNELPTADFTADNWAPCAGQTVTFTSEVSNNTTSLLWDFGGLGSSVAANPTFAFPAGVYTVKLTAYNGLLLTDVKTKIIRVDQLATLPYTNDFSNPDFYHDDWWIDDHVRDYLTFFHMKEINLINHPQWATGQFFAGSTCWGGGPAPFVNHTGALPDGALTLAAYNDWNNNWYNETTFAYAPDLDFSTTMAPSVSFWLSHVPFNTDSPFGAFAPCSSCTHSQLLPCSTLPPFIFNDEPGLGCAPYCNGMFAPACGEVYKEEALSLEYSTDCGANWIGIFIETREDLRTTPAEDCATNNAPPFFSSDWQQRTYDLCFLAGQPRVKLRFRYDAGEGTQMLYIDDFTVGDVAPPVQVITTYTPWSGVMTGVGDVEVYDVLDISSADIGFLPFSKITVKNGGTLLIDFSVLHADNPCQVMWQGIIVEPGGFAGIYNQTHILNAIEGLNSIDGGKFEIIKSKFHDNHTDVYLGPHASVHPGSIQSSHFTAGPLLYPYLGMNTQYFLHAEKVREYHIGDPSGTSPPNIITSPMTGVYNILSFGNFSNCQFWYINGSSSYGIYSEGDPGYRSTIYSGDVSGSVGNQFYFVDHAIHCTNNSDGYVVGSVFKYGLSAMHFDLGPNLAGPPHDVYIRSNNLTGYVDGVTVLNDLDATIKVLGNVMDIPNATGSNGIHVSRPTAAGSPTTVNITGNKINNPQSGIECLNQLNATVTNNEINQFPTTPVPAVCILLDGTSSSFVNENFITGNSHLSNDMGIYSLLSASNDMECNYVDKFGFSFVFEGNCNPATWKGNSISKYTFGMELRNSGEIGPQSGSAVAPPTDKWTGVMGAGGARLHTVASTGALSPYFYPLSPSYYTPFPSTGTTPIPCIPSGFPIFICANGINLRTDQSEETMKAENLLMAIVRSKGSSNNEDDYFIARQVISMASHSDVFSSMPDVVTFIESVNESNTGRILKIEGLINEGKFSEASAENSALTPLNSIEENHKFVFSLILRMFYDGKNFQIAEDEKAQLITIAESCPSTEGFGVISARQLCFTLFGHPVGAYEDKCNEKQIAETQGEGNLFAFVYPNPANNQVFVRITGLSEEGIANINLTSLAGHSVKNWNSLKVNEGDEQSLNLDGLANGIYILSVEVNGIQVHKEKVVVIH